MLYYQHHINDYISHTAHLTPIEDLIYRRLIELYYTTEKPILNCIKLTSKRIRLPQNDVEVMQILEEFFILNKEDNCYHSKRCDEDIVKYTERCKNAAEAVNKRWSKGKDTTGILTNNHKPITNTLSNEFNSFWQAYPKKVGKNFAHKAWLKHKPDVNVVLKALYWQTVSKEWKAEGGKYIPHPTTYLNQGRYLDEQPKSNNGERRFVPA